MHIFEILNNIEEIILKKSPNKDSELFELFDLLFSTSQRDALLYSWYLGTVKHEKYVLRIFSFLLSNRTFPTDCLDSALALPLLKNNIADISTFLNTINFLKKSLYSNSYIPNILHSSLFKYIIKCLKNEPFVMETMIEFLYILLQSDMPPKILSCEKALNLKENYLLKIYNYYDLDDITKEDLEECLNLIESLQLPIALSFYDVEEFNKILDLIQNINQEEIPSQSRIALEHLRIYITKIREEYQKETTFSKKSPSNILDLIFHLPSERNNQMPIEAMGNIMIALQGMFNYIFQSVSSNSSLPVKKIPKALKAQTELIFSESFDGSFGLRLIPASNSITEQMTLFEEQKSIVDESLKIFVEIIKANSDKNSLSSLVAKTNIHVKQKYLKSLEAMKSLNSSFAVEWYSHSLERPEKAFLSVIEIHKILSMLKEKEEKEDFIFNIFGYVSKIDYHGKKAVLRDLEHQRYHCDLKEQPFTSLLETPHKKLFLFTLQEKKKISEITEEVEISYVLLNALEQ